MIIFGSHVGLIFLILDIWRYMMVYEGIWGYVQEYMGICGYIRAYGGILPDSPSPTDKASVTQMIPHMRKTKQVHENHRNKKQKLKFNISRKYRHVDNN